MGYGYGIKQCRETLLLLSNNDTFEKRMARSFSELNVIEPDDVSIRHYKEIKEWCRKFLSITEFSVSEDGSLEETDKEKEFRNLANELVYICTGIIEHNSRNKRKQDL